MKRLRKEAEKKHELQYLKGKTGCNWRKSKLNKNHKLKEYLKIVQDKFLFLDMWKLCFHKASRRDTRSTNQIFENKLENAV